MSQRLFRLSGSLLQSFGRYWIVALCISLCLFVVNVTSVGQVIWAVNCGGDAHVDSFGIQYQRDPLKVGSASAHGRNIAIRRIAGQDQILYQTERYHTGSFGYDIPIKEEGDYVLVLKFSEVWFTEPNRKIFSVSLNHEHTVVDQLDIFAVAGFGMAHDEVVPFSVRRGKLHVGGESSIFDGTLHVEFVKLHYDNPKINAIYIMRGRLEDVPRLPPLPNSPEYQRPDIDEPEEEESESTADAKQRRRRGAEPRISDPYAAEDPSSMLVPIAVAIGVFIPVVFCLCKL